MSSRKHLARVAGVQYLLLGMAPLVLLSGDTYLSVFDKSQLQALALGFLNLRGYGIKANRAFWGLWLVPFGLLVYRSGFIPRILGVFWMVGCVGYIVASAVSLLFPMHARAVNVLTGLAFGEVLVFLWLVLKGARAETVEQPASA